ncbi:hypothetical protein [Sulfurimonas hydrogeniphila]|uniref:hypothetical protein n=1 Tax=Sulfurimonas hydrogeniphila TaxID=2509341 RepID=UPI00125FF800|nr:hypothetical protein [Sulfurimonas hydrogeniphila]
MFEYFNYGGFFFLVFLMLISFKMREEIAPLYGLFILVLVLIVYDAYASYSDAKSNLKAFEYGNTLTCRSGGGAYGGVQKYSVSKAEGWRVHKSYFIHDSLMIRADECELQ